MWALKKYKELEERLIPKKNTSSYAENGNLEELTKDEMRRYLEKEKVT